MTYFADLTPYSYHSTSGPWSALLNVGWLDPAHAYTTGPVTTEFITALARVCVHSQVDMMRGLYVCKLPPCSGTLPDAPPSVLVDGKEVSLGNAELRIGRNGGIWYDAPDLVYHYVTVHNYKPPEGFIEEVCLAAS